MVTTILCPSVTVGTSPTCCPWLTPEIHCLQMGQSSLSLYYFPRKISGFKGIRRELVVAVGKVPRKSKDTEGKIRFYCLLTKGLFL